MRMCVCVCVWRERERELVGMYRKIPYAIHIVHKHEQPTRTGLLD